MNDNIRIRIIDEAEPAPGASKPRREEICDTLNGFKCGYYEHFGEKAQVNITQCIRNGRVVIVLFHLGQGKELRKNQLDELNSFVDFLYETSLCETGTEKVGVFFYSGNIDDKESVKRKGKIREQLDSRVKFRFLDHHEMLKILKKNLIAANDLQQILTVLFPVVPVLAEIIACINVQLFSSQISEMPADLTKELKARNPETFKKFEEKYASLKAKNLSVSVFSENLNRWFCEFCEQVTSGNLQNRSHGQ